jgi:hypothetical protein
MLWLAISICISSQEAFLLQMFRRRLARGWQAGASLTFSSLIFSVLCVSNVLVMELMMAFGVDGKSE